MPVASRQRQRFRQQPISGKRLEINPEHWLGRDVIFAHTGHSAVGQSGILAPVPNPLFGKLGAVGNPALNAVGFVPDGANFVDYPLGFAVPLPLTLVVWQYGTNTNSTDPMLSVARPGAQDGGVTVARSTAERSRVLSYDTIGGNTGLSVTTGTFVAGDWFQSAGVFAAANTRTGYFNAINSATHTVTRAYPDDCSVVRIAGSAQASVLVSQNGVQGIALPIVASVALNADQMQRLYDEQVRNPWALFRERPTQIWLGSAAPTLPTLSAATATDITATSFRPRVSYAY